MLGLKNMCTFALMNYKSAHITFLSRLNEAITSPEVRILA